MAPIAYAIGFSCAYYGYNSTILGNVKNDYWGYEKVEDSRYLSLCYYYSAGFFYLYRIDEEKVLFDAVVSILRNIIERNTFFGLNA